MKKLMLILFVVIPTLNACTLCMSHWQRHKETGKYQMHHMKHVKCSCPCNGPRNRDGSCQQCGHKVRMESLHIKEKSSKKTTN